MRCYESLKRDPNRLCWGTVEERAAQHNLVPGFPLAIGFVDGAKIGRWRPEDEAEQERGFYGRKHTHCFATLVWTDNFGRYLRVDITNLGAVHDRRLYTQAPPYVVPAEHLSDDEHLLADTGFIGDGDECVCPFKKGMGLDFALRGQFNSACKT